jgi:uncharacterized membrane protein YfcA
MRAAFPDACCLMRVVCVDAPSHFAYAGSRRLHRQLLDAQSASAEQQLCAIAVSGMSVTEWISTAGVLLALAAMAAGAAAQAAIGMGLNLFAVPILALIDPVFVPGPVLFHSFLLSLLASYRLRADIEVRELTISVGGLLVGTAAAAAALSQIDTQQLPRLFGVLVLAAVAVTAAGVRIPLTTPGIAIASTVAGAMGTIAGVHGPPIALLYQRESPIRVRSALLPFFVFANGLSLAALAAIGMFGWRELVASVILLPGLAIGFAVSPWLVRLMSPGAIRACILGISAFSGVALAVKG